MNCMKKSLVLSLTALCLTLAAAPSRAAADKPFSLSLVTPIHLFGDPESITGLRINLLYGRNANLTGVDLGFINHLTGSGKGLQFGGVVNLVEKDFLGVQFASLLNYTKGSFTGAQVGTFNYAGNLTGLQLGLINYSERVTKGLQIGLANIIKTDGWLPFMILVNGKF